MIEKEVHKLNSRRCGMEVPRDGRPAKCTRRRLLNADDQNPENNEANDAKTVEIAGVPQTRQPISAVSGPCAEVHHIVTTCGGDVTV